MKTWVAIHYNILKMFQDAYNTEQSRTFNLLIVWFELSDQVMVEILNIIINFVYMNVT